MTASGLQVLVITFYRCIFKTRDFTLNVKSLVNLIFVSQHLSHPALKITFNYFLFIISQCGLCFHFPSAYDYTINFTTLNVSGRDNNLTHNYMNMYVEFKLMYHGFFDRLSIPVTKLTLFRIWCTTLNVLIELLITACGKEEVRKT